MLKQSITILGSTGSVGQSALDLIEASDEFELFAISANKNIDLLLQQCRKFNPKIAVLAEESLADSFQTLLRQSDCDTELKIGPSALEEVAADSRAKTIIAAIVGAAGLNSTMAAAKSGKKILLANKEALVMSGDLFMQAASVSGSTIIPIDSEHNAIFQCLPYTSSGLNKDQFKHVEKLVLTASGGPFLDLPISRLDSVTPEMACAHPTWQMGRKISVDSATMMNKGLELIEAYHLFGLEASDLGVLIHPQSVVHAFVHFVDGSVLAQLAVPDMRIPIAYGLAYPRRLKTGVQHLNLVETGKLEFREADEDQFPCFRLGRMAMREGGAAPILLNAANEVAVDAFLKGSISFSKIPEIIEEVITKTPCESPSTLAIIQDIDIRAKELANQLIYKDC